MKLGDKVKYLSGDKWLKGTIHGIRSADDEHGNAVVISYLVDTGKDLYVDERTYDKRQVEITNRLNKATENSKLTGHKAALEIHNALEKINQHDDLPKSEIVTEKFRQPETVDVRPDEIQPL